MNKREKVVIDRLLEHGDVTGFSNAEIKSVRSNLFGHRVESVPIWRRRYVWAFGTACLCTAAVVPVLINRSGEDNRYVSRADESAFKGAPVFEIFSASPLPNGEWDLRSVQGVDIVNQDEYLQFRIPPRSNRGFGAVFGIDERMTLHLYFPAEGNEGGLAISDAEDVITPHSINLGVNHTPGYLRVFFITSDRKLSTRDIETVYDEYRRQHGHDFSGLTDLEVEDGETSSRLLKIKPVSR